MRTEEEKAYRRELEKKYRQTEKFKEYRKKLRQTQKHKEYQKAYMKEYSKTETYKEKQKAYHDIHDKTEEARKLSRERQRKEAAKEYQRKYRRVYRKTEKSKKTERKFWWTRRLKGYGLTNEDYKEMLLVQGNCCAICGNEFENAPTRRACVNHCHIRNKVRGILCSSCNLVIGNVKESQEVLAKAITYLRQYED